MFDLLKHWLGFWCKPRIYREPDGIEVLVEYRCSVCARRDVTPEACERERIERESR